jgi:hypothetical protein
VSHASLYGESWHVISSPDPKNIAYSTQGIPPHMDLSYYESPPAYVHLGTLRHGDGRASHTVQNRLAAAHKFFGAARSIFRSRWASQESKTQLYIGAVLPTLLFGCESWLLDPVSWQKLTSFHHYCVRSMCRLNRLQVHERSIDPTQLLRKLRLQPIEYYIHRRQLRWFGDIARMHPSRLPRKMLLARPLSNGITPPRPTGRPRPSAESTLQAALEWAGINPLKWAALAQDATEWRSTVDSVQPLKPLKPKPPGKHKKQQQPGTKKHKKQQQPEPTITLTPTIITTTTTTTTTNTTQRAHPPNPTHLTKTTPPPSQPQNE